MLHFVPDGEHRFRLIDSEGREVGWIRGRAVRFLGFLSEEEMVTAVSKAWRALQAVLAGAIGRAAHGALPRQLRLVHDGAYEWISDGMIPIARVFRPRNGMDSSLAIELVMPSSADEQLTRAAALAIAEALRQPDPAPLAKSLAALSIPGVA